MLYVIKEEVKRYLIPGILWIAFFLGVLLLLPYDEWGLKVATDFFEAMFIVSLVVICLVYLRETFRGDYLVFNLQKVERYKFVLGRMFLLTGLMTFIFTISLVIINYRGYQLFSNDIPSFLDGVNYESLFVLAGKPLVFMVAPLEYFLKLIVSCYLFMSIVIEVVSLKFNKGRFKPFMTIYIFLLSVIQIIVLSLTKNNQIANKWINLFVYSPNVVYPGEIVYYSLIAFASLLVSFAVLSVREVNYI